MSSEDQTQIVQCVGCNSKLRVGGNAIGKTIACPKCGQQLKIKDRPAATPERKLVVAKPISSPSLSQGAVSPRSTADSANAPVMATPTYQNPAVGNDWTAPTFAAPVTTYQPYATQPKSSGKSQLWIWIAAGGTVGVLFLIVTLTVLISWLGATKSPNPPMASNNPMPPPSLLPEQSQLKTDPLPPASPPTQPSRPSSRAGRPSENRRSALPDRQLGGVREFPDLGPARPFGQSIVLHITSIPRGMQKPLTMNIFIPKGEHGNQSLPVMFESPNGTNLLHGANVEIPKPSSEYLPFTEAGMITVTFAIDGNMPRSIGPEGGPRYMTALQKAYKEFVDADAGVANGKLAIDYVLEKVPSADPKRLYIWGHSSAATLSLLMASKDKRLSKCIAMAPITDLHQRLGELLTEKSMEQLLPNLPEYFKSGSPITYVQELKCPVFVAHAHDDDNEPFKNTQAYVKSLRDAGGNITFEDPASGGHYQALLNAAVPKAVQWLKAD